MKCRLLELVGEFKKEVSGRTAKEHAAAISRFHRIQASPGFRRAAEYVVAALRELGYDARIREFPADGRSRYLGWRVPLGWEALDAELEVVKPEKRLIGKLRDDSLLLVVHSGSGSFEAEVFDAGLGIDDSDYEGGEGKVALASGTPWAVLRKAVEHGVAGLLLYREKSKVINQRPYTAFWPAAGDEGKALPAFSLTLEEALWIKAQLKRGKEVVVRGYAETRFYSGTLDVVEAVLSGDTEEEVVLIAHLCHPRPGGHDNASGSGLLIELARALKLLGERGVYRRRRTIRMLWVPEFTGTLALLAEDPGLAERAVAVINLDMVGGDQHATGGVLTIVGVNPLAPRYLPLLAYCAAREAALELEQFSGAAKMPFLRMSYTPYVGGSDHHVFADPVRGVASTALIEWPDVDYHSSLDLPDNLSPRVLRAVGAAAAAIAAFLSEAEGEAVGEAARLAATAAVELLALDVLREARGERPRGYASLVARAYADAVKSLARLDRRAENSVMKAARLVEEVAGRIAPDGPSAPKLEDSRVPKRIFRGPLHMRDVLENLPADRLRWWLVEAKPRDYLLADLLYQAANGQRSLGEIAGFLSVYLGVKDLQRIVRVAEDLALGGWLSL